MSRKNCHNDRSKLFLCLSLFLPFLSFSFSASLYVFGSQCLTTSFDFYSIHTNLLLSLVAHTQEHTFTSHNSGRRFLSPKIPAQSEEKTVEGIASNFASSSSSSILSPLQSHQFTLTFNIIQPLLLHTLYGHHYVFS